MPNKKTFLRSCLITAIVLIMAISIAACAQNVPPVPAIDVNFYLNDGSNTLFTTISGVPGETTFIPTSIPKHEGWKFTGWFMDTDSTMLYSDGSKYAASPPERSINVYAGWEVFYSVMFLCDYTNIPEIMVAKDSLIRQIPDEPVREGYTFDGWYIDNNFTIHWDFNADHVTSNTILYAHWIHDDTPMPPPTTFIVTFNSNGGSRVNAIKDVEYDSLISKPRNPSLEGYNFKGWFKDKDLNYAWDFANDRVTGDITLYARWGAIAVGYTVNFNTNGGSTIAPLKNIPKDSTITQPAVPTKDKYTFEGWYSNRDLTVRWDFGANKVTGDMTLYAKWTAITPTKYTVTFDSRGGTAVSAITNIEKNALCPQPAPPVLMSMEFVGWFYGANLEKQWDFYYDRVNENMTLYALWKPLAPPPPPPPVTFNIIFEPGETGAFERYVIRVEKNGFFEIPYHSVPIPGGLDYVWFARKGVVVVPTDGALATTMPGVITVFFVAGDKVGPVVENMTFIAQNPPVPSLPGGAGPAPR